MRRIVLSALAMLLGCAALASAQNPPATDAYAFKVYAAGATNPLSTTPLVNADILCNQAPITGTPSTVNPTQVEWDDVQNTGRKCVWRQGPTGLLVALPTGSYEGTVTLTDPAGTSPESAKAPFSRAPLPAARTGVRIVR